MRTLKMTIAYRGTRYHGFQRQPNAITVQGELEKQLSRVLNGQTTAYGCSRTDTGVHANQFVLHLHTEREIRCKNLVRALNGYLPDDISVLACEDALPAFHARFDCKGKEYHNVFGGVHNKLAVGIVRRNKPGNHIGSE